MRWQIGWAARVAGMHHYLHSFLINDNNDDKNRNFSDWKLSRLFSISIFQVADILDSPQNH